MKWLRKAADQGNTSAQNSIGLLYEYGGVDDKKEGVLKQDLVQAYFWYSMGACCGRKDRTEALAKKMTPEQIAQAQRLVMEWVDKRRKPSTTDQNSP